MGSFNTACFASNQIIAPGDTCRVIPIVRTKDFSPVQLLVDGEPASAYGTTSSNCYSNAFWEPVGACIAAVYDDYGQFKLSMSPEVCLQVLAFFRVARGSFPIALQGDNECHDVPFNFPEFLEEKAPRVKALLDERELPPALEADTALFEEVNACWDYIWEVGREQRLFQVLRGVISPVQFAVVHEAAYQTLREHMANLTTWNGEPMAPAAWAERTLKLISDEIADLKTRMTKDFAASADAENDMVARLLVGQVFSSTVRESMQRIRMSTSPTPRRASSAIQSLSAQYQAGTLTPEVFLRVLQPFLDDDYFYGGLEELGPRLSPMVYAGQDYSNEIGQAYAKFVAQVSQQVTRGRKSHYGGPFSTFTVKLPNETLVEALTAAVEEYDGGTDNVRLCHYRIEKADGTTEAFVEVTLDCTLSPKDFADFFTEFLDDNEAAGSIVG